MAIEYVEATKSIERLARKSREWNRDERPSELFGNPPPTRAGRNGGDERDVGLSRVNGCRRNQPFFQRGRKREQRIAPDIRNGAGWKHEEGAAISRLSDAGSHHVIGERCGVKAERGFFLVFGKPGGLPGIGQRVCGSVE